MLPLVSLDFGELSIMCRLISFRKACCASFRSGLPLLALELFGPLPLTPLYKVLFRKGLDGFFFSASYVNGVVELLSTATRVLSSLLMKI